MRIKFYNLLKAALFLAIGLWIGWMIKPSGETGRVSHLEEEPQAGQTWTCSMDPQVRRPEPGKCPICGMDLIPVDQGSGDDDPVEIRMTPSAIQLANIQTLVVGVGDPVKEVRMNGKIQADERRIFSQTVHVEGRVEQLFVNFTGEQVKKGRQLAVVYSPELVTAQKELLAAHQIRETQPGLYQASREKLKNWKLSDAQIDELIVGGKPREHFPVVADVSGFVLTKKVNLGDYVMRGMPIYEIVDLSRVWVLFDVYESDMAWVKTGDRISFTVQSLPAKTFEGRIAYLDPVINPVTRVAAARVEVPNPEGQLKPEMFVSGRLKSRLKNGTGKIMVPESAVLWTGERSVVYIKTETEGDIRFRMQEVTLGPSAGDGYLIEEGLEAGMEIAVSGTFSVDAAAQLSGKQSMMAAGKKTVGVFELDPALRQEMDRIFDVYFELKDALVSDDPGAAKTRAGQLKDQIEKLEIARFSGQAREHWGLHRAKLQTELQVMRSAAGLEEIRRQFKPFSIRFIELAKYFGHSNRDVFVQYCPMADGNKGAEWLSLEDKVLNPYFGSQMLTCGKVTERLAGPGEN